MKHSEIEQLKSRLRDADRVFQAERGWCFLLKALPCVLGLVVLLFCLDVVFHWSEGWRASSVIGLGVLCALLGGVSIYIAFFIKNRIERIARILESRDATLGSKLINSLQLEAQATDEKTPPRTQALLDRAVEMYADNLKRFELPSMVRSDEPARWMKRGAIALGIFVVLFLATFPIASLQFMRFVDPYGGHPPYSFTQLEFYEPVADPVPVVFGEDMLFKVSTEGHTPKELFLSFYPKGEPEEVTTVPMFNKGGELGFFQQIEAIKKDLVVCAHDRKRRSMSRTKAVEVLLTPMLLQAKFTERPPAYTGMDAKERPYEFKNVRVLDNSLIDFSFTSNRPLSEGVMTVSFSDDTPSQTLSMIPSASDKYTVTRTIALRKDCRIDFHLVDETGIRSEQTWSGGFTVFQDLPPTVMVEEPSKDAFVSMDFEMKVRLVADDDYGIASLRIHRGLNGDYYLPKEVSFDKQTRTRRFEFDLPIAKLGLRSGDVLSVFAEAIDNAPEPHLSRSKAVHLTVITPEDYNDYLRQMTDMRDMQAKYTSLLLEMNDLAERAKELGEQMQSLKEQLAQATTDEERAALEKKLNELMAKQEQINEDINALADKMENFVRENPLYDVESEMENGLGVLAKRLRESTEHTNSFLEDMKAGQPLLTAMLDDLMAANEDQRYQLGERQRELEDEVVKPFEEMADFHELVKSIERFKWLYRKQGDIVQQLESYRDRKELSRADQLSLNELAQQEQQLKMELIALEAKLRTDAERAEAVFPKAAAGATDIANAMRDARLVSLAEKSTQALLKGDGAISHQRASQLLERMGNLFSQCNAQGGSMCESLDQYLSLKKMTLGNNFQQMMQSRKLNYSSGFSPGQYGPAGQDVYGFSVSSQALQVMGSDTQFAHNQGGRDNNKRAYLNKRGEGLEQELDALDVLSQVPAVNRESAEVTSDGAFLNYEEMVDQYFKTITLKERGSEKEAE